MDGIEGCTQVEEDEDGESRIRCLIGDFDECCFGAMEWAETRPELFIQVIVG